MTLIVPFFFFGFFAVHLRDSTTAEVRNKELIKREVIGMTASGETFVLAEFSETAWSLMNSNWLLQLQSKFSSEKEKIFELSGSRKVSICQDQPSFRWLYRIQE